MAVERRETLPAAGAGRETPGRAPRRRERARRLIAWTVALVVATALGLWFLWVVRGIVLLVYTSALLAIALRPPVRLLEGRRVLVGRLPRGIAVLIVYVVVFGGLLAAGGAFVPAFVRQAREFAQRLPELLDRGQAVLVRRGLIEEPLTFGQALERVPGGGTDAVQLVLGALWGFLGGIVGLVTVLILAFYFLLDAERLRDALIRLFPAGRRRRAGAAATEIARKVSAWVNGQLLLSGIIGATSALALWLLGVPYFFVLALIAAIGEFIPVVGPVLAAVPAVAVALGDSVRLALFVVVFFLVQQQVENHVLVPRLMAHQVGVSPIMVILALLVGSTLLGIAGAILAVPSAAIVQVLAQEILRAHAAEGPPAR
jgi:predicted PurR-regulated permease PerM